MAKGEPSNIIAASFLQKFSPCYLPGLDFCRKRIDIRLPYCWNFTVTADNAGQREIIISDPAQEE